MSKASADEPPRTVEERGRRMQQIGVLHTIRARDDAGAFVRGLQSEGFTVPWDPAAGGMMAIGAAAPTPSACWVVLWTRDAATSKWVIRYAEGAHKRGALVEVLLEKGDTPRFPGAPEPLDFSEVDCSRPAASPMWKELIRRIEAKIGQPTGDLPFKKQIEPLAIVGVVGFAVVSTMAITGPEMQPSAQAVMNEPANYAEAKAEDHAARGGPVVAPENLVTARLESHALRVMVKAPHFDVIALPRVRVVEDSAPADAAGVELIRLASISEPS